MCGVCVCVCVCVCVRVYIYTYGLRVMSQITVAIMVTSPSFHISNL